MTSLFDIHGKVGWVTGASIGGLGYHHAQSLANEGVQIAISDLPSRSEELNQAENRLRSKTRSVLSFHADVSKEDEVRTAVTKIEEEFGKVDILVNNAGISVDQPAFDMRLEDWNRVLAVNLTGVWLCSRAVGESMVSKKISGKIINVASIYGLRADLDESAPYYATKAAVINLTRALAIEWARYGINVNAIGPGYFPSRMTRTVEENPEIKQRFLNRIPLKRAGDPAKDLAGALIFLASNASDYVTGQTIFVDGGWTTA